MLTDLTNIARDLVALSMVMAVQIGLVLLLRKPVSARLGAVACYRLWLLPLLWLPLYWAGPTLLDTLASAFYPAVYDGGQYPDAFQQFMQFELLRFNSSAGAAQVGAAEFTASYGWTALALLWASGSIALLVWHGRRWFDFSREVNKLASPLPAMDLQQVGISAHFAPEFPVLCLQGMRSAALFGIFKPMLLLPDAFTQRYDATQRHIILAHESVHLRRKDNLWNLGALLLLTLFWTNPVVLLAWRYYRLDQELSCDALTLKHCNKEQQKRYARTLLDSLGSLPTSDTQPALSAWDNLRDLKERSLMIKHHLLTATRPATMLFSLMLMGLFGASLTITFAELANAAESVEPQITRITGLIEEKKNEEARTELEPLLKAAEQGQLTADDHLEVLQISASLYQTEENYEQVQADLIAILELPNLPQETVRRTTYALGQSYLGTAEWQKSVEYIAQAIAMPGAGELPGPQYLLGVAHYQLYQYEEALPYAERAIELAV
ncbi:MAG: M56 family metallopeptidase, partial [Pseudomonadota bacterium]